MRLTYGANVLQCLPYGARVSRGGVVSVVNGTRSRCAPRPVGVGAIVSTAKVGQRMDFQGGKQIQRTGVSGDLERLQSERRAADAPSPPETILIVENEDTNRRLMEQILDFAGYRYLSASNGLEALDLIAREQVDLVLIDLSMPIMDGFRTTEIIRLRPQNATLPIVAVTAHAMSDDRELALRSGCTDYLAKPFRPNQLLQVVERLLNREQDTDSV